MCIRDSVGAYGHEGSGEGEFKGPYGVAVAPSGAVVVTDTGKQRVVVLRLSGADGTTLAHAGAFARGRDA